MNKKNIQYFTGNGLIAVNRHSIRYKKNRSIRPNILLGITKHYGSDYKYPIVFSMPHNENEIRCEVMIGIDEDKQPLKAWVDMDIRVYDRHVKETSV